MRGGRIVLLFIATSCIVAESLVQGTAGQNHGWSSHLSNIGQSPIVPSPSHPSRFLHGCETKAGVGRTGNEATPIAIKWLKNTALVGK